LDSQFSNIIYNTSEANFERKWAGFLEFFSMRALFKIDLARPDANLNDVERATKNRLMQIRQIVNQVACYGDEALSHFTKEFDRIEISGARFAISGGEFEAAYKNVNKELMASIRGAIENVRKYQTEIFVGSKSHPAGIKYTPVERVGVCVPGASAPLPSTVIMTAVPAQVAGVKEIAVVSPPRYEGSIHPVILAVCHELGIKEVYRIGGAQAVAALAFGTQTIRKVDKIVGPGNQWVTLAKKEVFGVVDIDSIAGPSEVLIIADENANPAWVAADMLSQAEHDPGSSAVLLTSSEELAQTALRELETQVKQLKRSEQTAESLSQCSKIIIARNMEEIIRLANEFAPEHLQIQCGGQSRAIAQKITNAGAIFVGEYTPVAVGDYWAGPSHTLPTGQSARFFSPLSSNDFIKATSIIEYDKQKLSKSAADIIRLAQTEGLDAHAKSISLRM
jgi:histidinol dehydrogenase